MYSEIDASVFDERVTFACAERGITLHELAVTADVAPGTLRNYRFGKTRPRASVLRRIADALGVHEDWLRGAAQESGRRGGAVLPRGGGTEEDMAPYCREVGNTLCRNLLLACQRRQKTPRDVAEEAGVAAREIEAILRGRLPRRGETVDRLARVLNVSPSWMWTGQSGAPARTPPAPAAPPEAGAPLSAGIRPPVPSFQILPPDTESRAWSQYDGYAASAVQALVPVPIFAGSAAAGAPGEVLEDEVEDWAFCYRPHVKHPEHTTCVRVRGDSMGDVVPDGALVGVDHAVRDVEAICASRSRLVAVRDPETDGAIIRRVKRVNGHVIFYPEVDSAAHPTIVWDLSNPEAANPVIGLVIFVYKACV